MSHTGFGIIDRAANGRGRLFVWVVISVSIFVLSQIHLTRGMLQQLRPFATLTVTNTNDSGPGSLRQTVINAAPGDTIVFGAGVTGAITLTSGEIAINKSLTINGPGAGVLAVSGNNSSRIFNITGAPMTIRGLTLRNGSDAGGGAAILLFSSDVTLDDLIITGNTSAGSGAIAFIANPAAPLNLNRVTISNNVGANTSGLYAQGGTVTIRDSTFSGNSGSSGEAIRGNVSTIALINSTVSGNSTTINNSAIRCETANVGQASILSLTNSTVTNNTTSGAAQRSAIWMVGPGSHTVTLRNSIVSGNTSGGVPADVEGALSAASSFSLVGTGGGLTNGVNSNIVGVNNPQLGPLASNGGPTQTHALLFGSPAMDKGSSFISSTDQRGAGFIRPVDLSGIPNAVGGDGADIGAFEAQATPSGAAGNPQMLFTSNRDGNVEIYKMNADGSSQTRLTNTPENESGGYWSPNGQKILYGKSVGAAIQVWTMNADGAGQTLVSDAGGINVPSQWSPDGQKILFAVGQQLSASRIWIMNANGSNKMAITTPSPNFDTGPRWSPDGTRIVFSRCNLSLFCDVFTVNIDGTNPVNLTPANPGGDDSFPAWSPNSNRIVFGSGTDTTAYNTFVMNADGSGKQMLSTATGSAFYQPGRRFPVSPNGSTVAMDFFGGSGELEVASVGLSGAGLANLTNNAASDTFGSWSPDGSRIGFVSRRDAATDEIYTMNANGTGVVRLTTNTATDTLTDWYGEPEGFCSTNSINIGSSTPGAITGATCLTGTDKTDNYTFTGTANQQIAISLETTQFFSKIELLGPAGTLIASAGGVNGVNTSRLPASGFVTLPTTGTYTIRAIAAFGGSGAYTLSVFQASVQTCTYALSSLRTEVPQAGGTFSFDIITQPGCPPTEAPATSGTFYTNASYSGGRVTFTLPPHPGQPDRQEVMIVAGQQHTIYQYCILAPINDSFSGPTLLQGTNSPPNNPRRGTNATATAQNGEPAHAGNPAVRSVWYVWTAPANGLYSFSTSGSSFDTVMAIYRCPAGSAGCSFTNFTPVGSNDDTTFFDVTSKVNFRADQGATYLVAVDGKNGATGTIELSWRQYERLFRLYLQTYNGNQSPLVPNLVTASNGSNTVIPTLVSLGVYEFNLPADGSNYIVSIIGPTGIVWDPNNFVLDTSFRMFDELMRGPEGASTGGQNNVSNAQFASEQYISGFVKNINQPEVGSLSVIIGSSRGPNPRTEDPCTPISFMSIAGVPYARYQCVSRPNTLHDIVPRMPGKVFVASVRTYDVPITSDEVGLPSQPTFIASNAPTYNVTGNVLAGGAGTQLELTYTPSGNTQPIRITAQTGANGAFVFNNLPPNTYRLKATRTGFVFTQPEPFSLTANQQINISPEVACGYTPGNVTTIPIGGGIGQFTVSTNQQTCEWAAVSDVPWITINSGAIVGNGPVHFTVQANPGAGRIGSIRIQGRSEPVLVQQATANPTFTTVSGRVMTPTLSALRNAIVTLVDAEGNRRTATTSSFGVFNFEGIPTGQIYTAIVTSKRYRFAPRAVVVTAAVSGIDLVGLE